MDIQEMHRLFRTIGQQMGLQQVRAILPESIDDYLNVAINEKCRSVLQQNASAQFKEKLSSQDNSVNPINALSTIYCSDDSGSISNGKDNCKIVELEKLTDNIVFEFISFFAIFVDNGTRWHRPCRIIEYDKLPYILEDYCNKPDNEFPVISLYTNPTTQEFVASVYMQDYTHFDGLVYNYIKQPDKVSFNNNVNCNLPVYLHPEIVEIAVQKFLQSVGATTKQVQ